MPQPDDLLTSSQAGDLLGVTDASIRRYANDGKLPHQVTPGGHRRFRRSDVLALIAAEPAVAS
jgi:excisionase family DNA binding protein